MNASDQPGPVGRVPSRGAADDHTPPRGSTSIDSQTAGSGDPAYIAPPHRLRRLHRVWPDRDGNISYLLTLCVDGRSHILDNETIFERFVAFLLDSPTRYHWFGRRFVIMPDHLHLIARMGNDSVRLGAWIKALKAVVGGLRPADKRPVRAPGLHDVDRVPTHGTNIGRLPSGGDNRELTRIPRTWRWQEGFHDHKFRTPESESRKWEYICLNPVRAGLVATPEDWPFGGEIFYDDGVRFVRGTPPLLDTGILIQEGDQRLPNDTAGSGDPAYKRDHTPSHGVVGHVPSHGVVGRVPPRGDHKSPNIP